jgi:hypothetical protein
MEELQHRGQDVHERTARTELPGQNCPDRTTKTGLEGQDRQEKKSQERTPGTGEPGQNSQNRSTRNRATIMHRTTKTSLGITTVHCTVQLDFLYMWSIFKSKFFSSSPL